MAKGGGEWVWEAGPGMMAECDAVQAHSADGRQGQEAGPRGGLFGPGRGASGLRVETDSGEWDGCARINVNDRNRGHTAVRSDCSSIRVEEERKEELGRSGLRGGWRTPPSGARL